MIDFYYAPTPNGWKVAIMLEETGLPYDLKLMDLHAGEQFDPDFMAISPNAKMPAILDRDPGEGYGSQPVPVFESAVILLYLAQKTGRFLPARPDRRVMKELGEWLFWQTGSQGPMAGQLSHFRNYAPEDKRDYGFKRYLNEYDRNLGVLENRLGDRPFIMGEDYTIADMQAFPWAFIAKPLGASLDDFPRVADWRQRIKTRQAVMRAIDLAKDKQNDGRHNVENDDVMYNQTAETLRRGRSTS